MFVMNILESWSNKRRQNLGVGSMRTQLKTARTHAAVLLVMSASSTRQWTTPRYCLARLCTATISWWFLLIDAIRVCTTDIHVQYDINTHYCSFLVRNVGFFFFYYLCFWIFLLFFFLNILLSFILKTDESIFHLISFFHTFFGYFILSSIVHLYFIIILYYI